MRATCEAFVSSFERSAARMWRFAPPQRVFADRRRTSWFSSGRRCLRNCTPHEYVVRKSCTDSEAHPLGLSCRQVYYSRRTVDWDNGRRRRFGTGTGQNAQPPRRWSNCYTGQ